MIEIRGLHKSWGNFSLFDINLKIAKGEFFGLFGHNGAGKTLLLETIAGIWYPDEGEIVMNGKSITTLPPEERNIGFVYQEHWLFPHLSVKENILFGLSVRRENKNEIKNRLKELTALLKLEEIIWRKNVTLLSGGEKQKIALARALATNPKLLLFDEPTHSLDEENRKNFYHLLDQICKDFSPTIIYVSHDYDEFKNIAHRIGVMEKGKLIRVDKTRPQL